MPEWIGVISDTHGLLRPEAALALAGASSIVHAGDVGSFKVLEALRAIAPVSAVRGNVDLDPWASELPQTAVVEAGPFSLYVLHDVKQLKIDPAAHGYAAVISGHSHRPGEERRGGVLYLNPGAAGPRRFHLPVTLARLYLESEGLRVEFVNLLAGE
jgi:putative phosphoesterase